MMGKAFVFLVSEIVAFVGVSEFISYPKTVISAMGIGFIVGSLLVIGYCVGLAEGIIMERNNNA